MKSSVKFDIAHVLMVTLFQVSCVSCNIAMVADAWNVARASAVIVIVSVILFFVFRHISKTLSKKGK